MFQQNTNVTQAPAQAGDFASRNVRHSALVTEGGYTAGPGGLTIGLFAWADPSTGLTLSNSGLGAPTGFVHREEQALITAFLGQAGYVIPAGFGVGGLFDSGDCWVKNAGTGAVIPGMKAYANNTTGAVTFGSAGAPPSDFSMTASIAALPGSATTSTISDNVFTVQTLASGSFYPGSVLSGTGVAAGTVITKQLTGTAGGSTGATYLVNPGSQAVASTTITGAAGLMTVTAATTGTVHIGDVLVAGGGGGSNTVAGTTVTALGTGTGGTGTYVVNNNTVVTSGVIAGTGGTETKWFAFSRAATLELVMITSTPPG
jgi:hypothetical protein